MVHLNSKCERVHKHIMKQNIFRHKQNDTDVEQIKNCFKLKGSSPHCIAHQGEQSIEHIRVDVKRSPR